MGGQTLAIRNFDRPTRQLLGMRGAPGSTLPSSAISVMPGAAVVPWLVVMLAFLLLVTYVPALSVWLPHALRM